MTSNEAKAIEAEQGREQAKNFERIRHLQHHITCALLYAQENGEAVRFVDLHKESKRHYQRLVEFRERVAERMATLQPELDALGLFLHADVRNLHIFALNPVPRKPR